MKFSKFLVIAALLGAASFDQENSVQAINLSSDMKMQDFNGADEDEIMDKVFTKYSTEGKDHNGISNGIRILMKKDGPRACSIVLEATHKLKGPQVPGYIKANFDKVWNDFDVNEDGFIKAEETHTFMRSMMGKLNKFALAPGSLSDIGGAGPSMAASGSESPAEEAPKPAPKKKAAPKKKVEEAPAESTEAAPAAAADPAEAALQNADAALLAEVGGEDGPSAQELQLAAGAMQGI